MRTNGRQQQCDQDGLGLVRLETIETLLERCRREGLVQTLVELAHTTSTKFPVAYGEMVPLLPEKPPEPQNVPPVIPPVSYQEMASAVCTEPAAALGGD